jgi:hypothetical protein
MHSQKKIALKIQIPWINIQEISFVIFQLMKFSWWNFMDENINFHEIKFIQNIMIARMDMHGCCRL